MGVLARKRLFAESLIIERLSLIVKMLRRLTKVLVVVMVCD